MTIEADKTRNFATRGWDALRIGLGILLLTAAILKFAGMQVSGVPRVGRFASVPVQMAAAEWELALGLWLLSGAARTGSWVAAVVTFGIFASVSGYLGHLGQATCGCFGIIKASPWHAFSVDVLTLVMLACFRPASARLVGEFGFRRTAIEVAVWTVAIGALIAIPAGVVAWRYGSLEAALARLRGETITVAPSYVDFGEGKPGETLERTVEVRNWTDRTVCIIGGTSDCSCVTTEGLPIAILPGKSCNIPIQMTISSRENGAMTRTARLLTGDDSQRTLELQLGCFVQ
jgi:methylamine utilization protein MauE/uncharacterized protein DUF1573